MNPFTKAIHRLGCSIHRKRLDVSSCCHPGKAAVALVDSFTCPPASVNARSAFGGCLDSQTPFRRNLREFKKVLNTFLQATQPAFNPSASGFAPGGQFSPEKVAMVNA